MATASERRSLQLEMDMMKELGAHRHLVTMLACCSKGSDLALVMEYVPGGNLHDFLRSHRQNVRWKNSPNWNFVCLRFTLGQFNSIMH